MMPATSRLGAKDYVHLHNHTHYSLLDGLTKVPALIERVQAFQMQAVAMTDHGTLSGAIEFYQAATGAGVKPIIGLETYVAARGHLDKEPTKDKPNFHLILLAETSQGYQNLMRLSTIANLEGFYYKPRIDHELLATYNQGLIVLSGCIGGEIGDNLRAGQYAKAKQIAAWYKKIFGDRYYLEIQDHGHPDHPSSWPEQVAVTKKTFQLGQELNIPCVVTCDAHYLNHDDQAAHEILLCVQTASFLSDEKRLSLKDFELHVTDPKEIIKRWGKDHPEIITNSKKIAERCNVEIELGKILIPTFPLPKGETEKTHLDNLVFRGLAERYGQVKGKKLADLDIKTVKKTLPKTIIARAEYELSVMDDMGYNGYFLIVQDFINWGKDRGIIFGPGRGSAAGSIVAYALKITEIEPLKYNLMFERFLNPGRISMPDIDIDIQDTRRDEVIQYCVEKYGSQRVANIVTFGRMAARNAIRDVARVLQVPYAEADRLSKMVPSPIQGRHIPLVKSIKDDKNLAAEYKNNQTTKKVFDLAIQLEGTIRSHGVHAAGVVIAPDDIVKFAPLEMAQKGVVATQYSMGPIEEIGLLKMDFLGLSNLTIINNALRIIRRVYGNDISLNDIPNDDEKTIDLFARADTTGIFQFESAGMKRYLRQLQPTEFEDLIAMNALYRPGPMAEIPRFIKGKNDAASITYPHESLKPVLEDTFGVIVYQENIIQLLQLVAGYSPGEADLVRKAIGKKKRDIMAAEEPRFIAGCLKKGLTQKNAEKLWAQIQPFADYSFNKAHATCYSQIAYWTAYLKAHYPAAFMAALMTSSYDDSERLAIDISDCLRMGIAVLPPDINESFLEFAVVPGQEPRIRFGLYAVKNVGSGAVEEILRGRKIDGEFLSLEDFLAKVSPRLVNRKTLESLIKAGAFDRYNERSTLLHNLDNITAYAARRHKQASSGQTDLFGNKIGEDSGLKHSVTLEAPAIIYTTNEQLKWERELLGLYLSQHPLAAYETFLGEQTRPLNALNSVPEAKPVTVGGLITAIREIVTKNGQKMAFIKLADRFGETELLAFPKTFSETGGVWALDRVILVNGKVNNRSKDGSASDELKIIVETAREVTIKEASNYQPSGQKPKLPGAGQALARAETAPRPPAVETANNSERVYIRLTTSQDEQQLLRLKSTIDDFRGQTEVVLVLGPDDNKQIIKLPVKVAKSSAALNSLELAAGSGNIKVQ
ncbi:MAG: DNA polymerase III subunit alpha [Candidatus Saccharimonadales bacterium]